MKYSYNWLQKHIKESLPAPSVIANTLTAHAFEVEEVVSSDNDTAFDIKVLPDRSHDALSHQGMALELSQLLGLTYAKIEVSLPELTLEPFPLAVTDYKASPRFMAMLIKNIQVEDSPIWLKQSLETIGQRSINNIVDATNYVLYDQGKPMHAFDADKIVGGITTRFAKSGESLTTLDGKLIVLDDTILVLADDQGALDIAGIKGGTKAEVDKDTKSIVLVSSNFDSALIRQTTQKIGIRTDAAKRFENGITSELCATALFQTAEIVLKTAATDATEISKVNDIYPQPENWVYKVGVSADEINKVLGTDLKDDEVERLLQRRNLKYTSKSLAEVLDTEVSRLIGKKYVNPSNMRNDAPNMFSCSSLVSYLYTLAGIPMPSISVDKYVFSEKITENERKLGDLIFSNTGQGKIYTETIEYKKGTSVPEGIDHVGIYMGDGRVLHASKSLEGVDVEDLSNSKNFQGNVRYGRIVQDINSKRYVVEVPAERLDIRIKEDVIDEIGKLLSTDTAKPSTTYNHEIVGVVSKLAYYISAARNLLADDGYSEVMTTSFSDKGDVAILNSVDPKKNHLRSNLQSGIAQSLLKGIYNSAYLGKDTIKVFEIGNVFKNQEEQTILALGIVSKNKKVKKEVDGILKETLGKILNLFPCDGSVLTSEQIASYVFTKDETNKYSIFEISLTEIIGKINDSSENKQFVPTKKNNNIVKYQTLSNYPFITRDIAVFLSELESVETLEGIIKNKSGNLAVKIYQFDKFQKVGESRISYGYRVVFQALDRTLTDSEVEVSMHAVYEAMKEKNWEVR